MKVIGCDFHPSFQQIAMLDESTGELTGRRLSHPAEAEARRALSIFLLTAASAIIERENDSGTGVSPVNMGRMPMPRYPVAQGSLF